MINELAIQNVLNSYEEYPNNIYRFINKYRKLRIRGNNNGNNIRD